MKKLVEEVTISDSEAAAHELIQTLEKIPDAKVGLQMYIEDSTTLSDSMVESNKLSPKQKNELADLIIGRLILGIPDNHGDNFLISDKEVISIDHAI